MDRRRLAIWGERLTTPRRLPAPGHHPTALPVSALRGDSEDLEWVPSDELCILLPTLDTTMAHERVVLAPHRLPALMLPSGDALDWLLQPDIRRSDSAEVLARLARLATEVVAAGCFTAKLVTVDGRLEARWVPSRLPGAVAERLTALSAALPAVGRAALAEGEDTRSEGSGQLGLFGGFDWSEHPLPPAHQVLRAAFEVFVDQICRDGLAGALESLEDIGEDAVASWIKALAGGSCVVEATPAEARRLVTLIQRAIAPPEIDDFGHLRLCLQLQAPADDDVAGSLAGWRLNFLLQSKADPTLLVPAKQVWESAALGDVAVLAGAGRVLRAGLTRAAQIWPVLESCLTGHAPDHVMLGPHEALSLLKTHASLLSEAGFAVLAPIEPKTVAVGLKASVVNEQLSQRPSQMGAQALMNVDWSVALGEDALSIDELKRIAALKAPIVKMRGEWVEFRPEHIARALRFVETRTQEAVTPVEALRSGLGLSSASVGLPVVGFEASGALGQLLKGEAKPKSLKAPKRFNGKLRPYQARGLSWLSFMTEAGLGACLADDMGLGKTVQVLALLLSERSDRRRKRAPTLLVCPMSVVSNWAAEAKRFAPSLRVLVYHGPSRRKVPLGERLGAVDLVITTYALAHRDSDQIEPLAWGRVVLDEAQNIKNSAARQTQAIRRIQAASRLALTGTPVENRLSELWSIMTFLNPGLLGSARAFDRAFAQPIEVEKDAERAELLRRLVQPFLLRRVKTDPDVVKDLPEKLEFKVSCGLTSEQASLYKATVDAMVDELDTDNAFKAKGVILTTMVKLKQICDHPAILLGDVGELAGRSHKLDRVTELVGNALEIGDKTLIFTQFTQMGQLLKRHLEAVTGGDVPFLHGGSSRTARDRMVEAFQSEDGPQVFILSIKAGGTGLNLTAANQVIHYDRWWNPAVEDQATDRAYRIGQTRRVQVRKLICAGTLEEKIDAMIDAKKALADQVVGAGDGWLAELSTDALREVVALAAEWSDDDA